MKIHYRSIAVVRSPFSTTEGMPIQPSRAKGVLAKVVFAPEYSEGLRDLEGFSHIILLCHLHRAGPYQLLVVPFLDDEPRGLFSTRAPSRPNPIGLSVVRLLSVNDNTLEIADVDLLDGTPVLDIKPYIGEFDYRTDVRFGWLQAAQARSRRSDNRFGE
jgi:tRNA-Thr(GGU) m(6)t(6)A37 methyltransferase TsaA